MSDTARSSQSAAQERLNSLRALLQQKFPTLRHHDAPEYGVIPSGLPGLDALLPGGAPRGAMTLLSGGPSSGKTSVALTWVARWTAGQGLAAWVHPGSFSPPSALQARVDLGRLLSVRVNSGVQALRCADLLLRWQAFAVVVLDWPWSGGKGSSWNRLQRQVTGSRSVLLVLAEDPRPGDPSRFCASVHLRCGQAEGIQVVLEKSRYGASGDSTTLLRGGMPGAPFPLSPDLPGLGQRWHNEMG